MPSDQGIGNTMSTFVAASIPAREMTAISRCVNITRFATPYPQKVCAIPVGDADRPRQISVNRQVSHDRKFGKGA
jgi:hypothetical protein